jgi:hypothetical protein
MCSPSGAGYKLCAMAFPRAFHMPPFVEGRLASKSEVRRNHVEVASRRRHLLQMGSQAIFCVDLKKPEREVSCGLLVGLFRPLGERGAAVGGALCAAAGIWVWGRGGRTSETEPRSSSEKALFTSPAWLLTKAAPPPLSRRGNPRATIGVGFPS